MHPMASGLQPYLDSLKHDDLADVVSCLCLFPWQVNEPIAPRMMRQQRRCVLEHLISEFLENPQATRARTSKAKSAMVKEKQPQIGTLCGIAVSICETSD